jgi:hypothetical protein
MKTELTEDVMFAITRRIAAFSLEVAQTIDCDEDRHWPPFKLSLFDAGQRANWRNIAYNNANKVIMIPMFCT